MTLAMTPSGLMLIVISTAILVVGLVDDLRSRKFHNWLFVSCALVATVAAIAVGGLTGLMLGFLGFTAGFAIMLPLVQLKIIGAGDMKLMAAFGIVAGWNSVLVVGVLALVWGAIFGLVRAVVGGQIKTVAHNMFAIVALKQREGLVLQTMPFTVAIFFGWLTNLVLMGVL